jgi:hypothetical protein
MHKKIDFLLKCFYPEKKVVEKLKQGEKDAG